jgi:hypothetical protein
MSLSERMNEILCRWQGEDIRRRDGSLPVWDVGRPGLFARRRRQRREAVAACRRELLATMLDSEPPLFLTSPWTPEEYEVPGHWQSAGEATWLVPVEFDFDHPPFQYWLFAMGDWRLYRAAKYADGRSPDVFRCSAAELLAWMNAQTVQALIESFHDDTDWVVALSTV